LVLYGGRNFGEVEDRSYGGPNCASEMTNEYRILVCLFSTITQIILIY